MNKEWIFEKKPRNSFKIFENKTRKFKILGDKLNGDKKIVYYDMSNSEKGKINISDIDNIFPDTIAKNIDIKY